MRARARSLAHSLGLSAVVGTAGVAGTAGTAGSAGAQQIKPLVQWQARADFIAARESLVQIGGGLNLPAGYYVRLGVDVAGGPQFAAGRTVFAGRTDFTARFLLDPFMETRYGLYGGGGVSVRWTDVQGWREYLVVLAGLEGPAHSGWRSAIEAGLGGGTRVGVVLRRARTASR